MALENGKISSRQLMLSIAAFIQGSTLVTSFVTSTTQQDTWIVVIVSYGLALLLGLMFTAIARRFPGKNLIQINEIVFGPVAGKILSAMYAFYFFSVCTLNTRDIGEFVTGYIMPETPELAVEVLFLFVCVWAVRKGVETMTRYGFFIVLTTMAVTVINSILLFKNMKVTNFQPVLSLPLINYVKGTNTITCVPFGEVLAFFMVFPSVREQNKIKKAILGGLSIGAITMFAVVTREISVLGKTANLMTLPSFESVRLIQIANILTRMEVLYALILITVTFFKVSILLYAAVMSVAQLLRLKSYQHLVPAVAAIAVLYTNFAFDTSVEHGDWGKLAAGIYTMIFVFLLPLTMYAISAFRRLRTQPAPEGQDSPPVPEDREQKTGGAQ